MIGSSQYAGGHRVKDKRQKSQDKRRKTKGERQKEKVKSKKEKGGRALRI